MLRARLRIKSLDFLRDTMKKGTNRMKNPILNAVVSRKLKGFQKRIVKPVSPPADVRADMFAFTSYTEQCHLLKGQNKP